MKKRILYCLSSLNHGGMEMVVLNYLNHLNLNLFQIDFLVFYGKEGHWDHYLREKGCKVTYFTSDAGSFRARNQEIRSYFRENQYDIVHIHAMTSLKYRYAKIAKKAGTKCVIYHSHNTSNETHLLLHKILRSRLNKWCDYRFACSKAAGKFMYNRDFTVIHNAIDLGKFQFSLAEKNRLCEQFHCFDSMIVGNIARFTKVKNHQFILKVLSKLNCDYKAVFIGDGPEKNRILEETVSLGLSDRVVFLGNMEDTSAYYNLFDVVIFPSQFEGLSMVMVEAQANGCKIIGSDKMSREVVLTDDIELLPIDDTEENYQRWADRLLSLRGQVRNDNRERLKQQGYDIETAAKKLEEFYCQI